MSHDADFVRAKRKITEATDWRGDVTVAVGDESLTFHHRLLTETEFIRVQQALDTQAAMESGKNQGSDGLTGDGMGETEAQERLLELQSKEELTESEREELKELNAEVAGQTAQIKEALGQEGFDLMMEMGREVIEPSDEDVRAVYDLLGEEPAEAMEMLGLDKVPQAYGVEDVRGWVREELRSMIEDQPYPIKLNVGLQATMETISVLGNGLPSE
jgi:hypothetical protein